MSETNENTDAITEPAQNEAAEAEAQVTPENKGDTVVPVREVQKERRERQKLEKQLKEMQAQQEEARQAELTEVERLKEELNNTRQQMQAAEQARVLSEQKSLIRTAASKAGYSDVEDAITFVDFASLDGLEGQELTAAVSEEVARVATAKPYLLQQQEEGANRKSVGRAADRDNANQPPAEGEEAISGFVHSLLFGKN